MNEKIELELVENFIFNDEVHNTLEKIKNSVMNFNVLEITGMGAQEIKHSNLLSWMLGDNEHNLEYRVLEGFLKKIVDSNEENENTELLKHYVYLPQKNRNITIYREKDNIDLLIVDDANKVVIAIENKVYASEREDGGGQLKEYYDIVNEKYSDYELRCFVYLTIGESLSSESNQENWMVASHKMIGEVVKDLLNVNNMNDKTELILTSYVDLLQRRNIMEKEQLKELCEKIWSKNSKALDILFRYRTTNLDKLYNLIVEEYKFCLEGYSDIKTAVTDDIYKHIFGTTWLETEDNEKRAIDILLVKKPSYIWIGYFHPNIPSTDDKQLLNLYNNIFGTKKQREKKIIMIEESAVEDLSEDLLKDKANEIISELNLEIKKFETTVNSLLGCVQDSVATSDNSGV